MLDMPYLCLNIYKSHSINKKFGKPNLSEYHYYLHILCKIFVYVRKQGYYLLAQDNILVISDIFLTVKAIEHNTGHM